MTHAKLNILLTHAIVDDKHKLLFIMKKIGRKCIKKNGKWKKYKGKKKHKSGLHPGLTLWEGERGNIHYNRYY